MRKSKFSDARIVAILREAEADSTVEDGLPQARHHSRASASHQAVL